MLSGNRLPKDSLKEGLIPYVIAQTQNNGIHMSIHQNTVDYHGNPMKLFRAPSITFSIDNPEAIFLQDKPFYTSNIMRVLYSDNLIKEHYIFFLESIKLLTLNYNWGIKFSGPVVMKSSIWLPLDAKSQATNFLEIEKIGKFIENINILITLHQRTFMERIVEVMEVLDKINRNDLFTTYYSQWIRVYKEGAIRDVTMAKYRMTHSWLEKLVPSLLVGDINRTVYQQLLNEYAIYHERQTTMDFHHQLKGAILDAIDEGLIDRDPTRKAIIKGKTPREKKPKYINQFELHSLLNHLNLEESINWDWLILLIAKTGMRFSEALALTPSDFDFSQQTISINKTWDYKKEGGFLPTKNKSSVRKIQIDWQTTSQFSRLVKDLPVDLPIFVNGKVYNSTVNGILLRHCRALNIPTISIHGLRHTHASLLLFAGVSIASVARRLGHSSMTTTQKTYLHIIHELENQDTDLVIRSLSRLI